MINLQCIILIFVDSLHFNMRLVASLLILAVLPITFCVGKPFDNSPFEEGEWKPHVVTVRSHYDFYEDFDESSAEEQNSKRSNLMTRSKLKRSNALQEDEIVFTNKANSMVAVQCNMKNRSSKNPPFELQPDETVSYAVPRKLYEKTSFRCTAWSNGKLLSFAAYGIGALNAAYLSYTFDNHGVSINNHLMELWM